MFCKKSVLGNFAKLTGKRLCQRLFLIKLQTFFYRTPPVTAFENDNVQEEGKVLGILWNKKYEFKELWLLRYVWFRGNDGLRHVSLVSAQSRVASTKSQSIPTIELQTA